MENMKPAVQGVAAVTTHRHQRSLWRRIGLVVPHFFWLFLAFVILKLVPELPFVADFTWRDAITFGNYGVSIVDLFYLGMIAAAIGELARVSHPGVDNTKEAGRMMNVATLLIILLIVGVVINVLLAIHLVNDSSWLVRWLSTTFSSTEFLVLTLVSRLHAPIAYLVNARTLKRTIDYGATES